MAICGSLRPDWGVEILTPPPNNCPSLEVCRLKENKRPKGILFVCRGTPFKSLPQCTCDPINRRVAESGRRWCDHATRVTLHCTSTSTQVRCAVTNGILVEYSAPLVCPKIFLKDEYNNGIVPTVKYYENGKELPDGQTFYSEGTTVRLSLGLHTVFSRIP